MFGSYPFDTAAPLPKAMDTALSITLAPCNPRPQDAAMSLRMLVQPATAILALAACTLSACTTAVPTPRAESCNAEAAHVYVGQAATPAIIDAARRAAGAVRVRALKPGQMVTMEFLEGRLNVYVDASNVILRAACG